MNRRTILLGCTALAACGTQTAQIVTDTRLVAGGVQAVTDVLEASTTVSTVTKAQIAQYNSDLQAAASVIVSAGSQSTTINAQTLATAASKFGALALTLLPAGSTYALTVTAALALLPTILAATGVAMATAHPTMTPDQARAILRAKR